ncbi:hypothetical protein N7481_002126 [Penicillium waksmanii]|uniref:uncharacterized protein n=1 Tax=Penicillium waksmanii TaxID=69791 RepID=UPI002549460B|nr:uncharacterized protein N7481_002126 [Penicillium waksmanii]KAJ5995149.1 hypothetical protein N7481_002126 [Penicillium waksmanii]
MGFHKLMQYLSETFQDPNRKLTARQEYESLKQGARDEFSNFLADYFHLAEEADLSLGDRKQGLYHRLFWRLQKEVTVYLIDSDLNFLYFVHCMIIVETHNEIPKSNVISQRAMIT